MTTKSNTPIKTDQNKQRFQSAVRRLFGGILGATAYLITALIVIVIEQSSVDYDLGFIRYVIDVSLFPAWLLFGYLITVPDESMFYLLSLYGLSSIPYAVLGALIAVRTEKNIILLVMVLITIYFYVSWFFARMFAAILS
jgi:hypothetical protein